MKPIRLSACALAMAIGLTSCGLEFSGEAADPASAIATTVVDASFNDRDVLYSQLMLVHSRQAVTLANLALAADTDASDSVKLVATRIKIDHASEIERMTLLLRSWKRPLTFAPTPEPLQLQTGILTAKHVDYITSLRGAAFDSEYLESMISHHEGSIDMARREIIRGQNVSLLEMAKAVVTKRQSSIDAMNTLLS